MPLVVKIQRPIEPPDGQGLIYTRDRSFMVTADINGALLELMGDRMKIYAEALVEGGDLVVVRVLGDQPW